MSTRYTPEELEAVRRASEEQRAALIEEGTCPGCGGDGVVLGDNYGWTGQPSERRCTECHGSGKYTDPNESWFLPTRDWA